MPVVWLIDAYRAGERAQVLALVEALDWPFETVRLAYRPYAFTSKLLRRSDLSGIDLAHSDLMQAPWPDLVVSCGMANEPVCRWIREQSGGHTRIVHVGRPWSLPSQIDLVITTPQYRLPSHPNVLVNDLTLNRLDASRLQAERERWSGQFARRPGPKITVVLGGNSGPFTLGPLAAARLARQACDRARELGASLLVSSSSRTSAAALEAFEGEVDVSCELYRWRADDPENPYFGMLAVADEIIVTADSIAMLSEAVSCGCPVWMFDLGGMRSDHKVALDFRSGALLYTALMRWGWSRLSRDITLVHQRLGEARLASWLGEVSQQQPRSGNPDLQRALDRVRGLLEGGLLED